VSGVLRRDEVLVTPVLVAAWAAVKAAELNENKATAAIKMLRARIKFLLNVRDAQSPNQRGMSVAVTLLCPRGPIADIPGTSQIPIDE
jgi:hypothetical protein